MPTILEQLSNEFKSHLTFRHHGVENKTRPGQPHRVGDTIKFSVYAKNNSLGIGMKNIDGTISKTMWVDFNPVSFSNITLGPGEEKKIADIETEIIADLNIFFDIVAIVHARASADLSDFRFTDFGILMDNILPA